MNWFYAIVGMFAAGDAAIGGYVFFKNPSRPLHRVFLVFAFGMGLVGGGMVLLFATHHLVFDRIVFAGGYLMIFGLVLLSMKFPTDKKISPRVWLLFLPLAILALLTPFGFLVKSVIFRPDGILEPVNGPGIGWFAIIIGAYVILSVWQFWKSYRSLSGVPRLQLQYLALGAGTFALVTFVCNVLLPAVGIFDLNLLGPVSSSIFLGSVGYAIVRHELLDIRVVVQRSAIYLALIGIVIAFYLGMIFVLGHLFGKAFDLAVAVSGGLTACVGVFTVPMIERYFRRLTDPLFFKDTYDYASALEELSEILNQNLETLKILEETSLTLARLFRTSVVELALSPDFSELPRPDSSRYSSLLEDLQRTRKIIRVGGLEEIPRDTASGGKRKSSSADKATGIEVAVPIILAEKFIGGLLLGPKRSGEPYRPQDMRLLTTLAYQLAAALEKARLYEEVRAHSEHLEERVRERTAELEGLQEKERSMMADISHRLQTPLTVVKSKLGSLRIEPVMKPHLEIFERSIDDISKFIYDLMNLVRLGMPHQKASRVPVDTSALIENIIEYFQVLAEEKNMKVEAAISPDVSVLGNKDMLEELVTNLLSNAYKYMGDAEPKKIWVRLWQEQGQVVLEVEDSGPGIPRDDLRRIFERSYRGHRSQNSDGMGLGLAITKRIVENHGGAIAIQSEPGQGTKVTVTFPAAP